MFVLKLSGIQNNVLIKLNKNRFYKQLNLILKINLSIYQEGQQYYSYKHHWSDQRKSIVLVVSQTSLLQKDPGMYILQNWLRSVN